MNSIIDILNRYESLPTLEKNITKEWDKAVSIAAQSAINGSPTNKASPLQVPTYTKTPDGIKTVFYDDEYKAGESTALFVGNRSGYLSPTATTQDSANSLPHTPERPNTGFKVKFTPTRVSQDSAYTGGSPTAEQLGWEKQRKRAERSLRALDGLAEPTHTPKRQKTD